MLTIRKGRRSKLPPMDARERAVYQATLGAVKAVRAATNWGAVSQALSLYDVYTALGSIRIDVGEAYLQEHLPEQYRREFQESGKAAATKLLNTLKRRQKRDSLGYAFDVTNPHAAEFARLRSTALIVEWGKTSRAAIQKMIGDAFDKGITPQQLTRMIADSGIGLTDRQSQAVAKRRADLLEDGLSPDKVDARVERYANQLLRQRGEAIARTEIITANRVGAQDSWAQAAAEGLINLETATQEWIATPGERTCDICEPLDGKTAKVGGTFPGGYSGPPAHPQCLPGDAFVSAGGRISAVSKRRYNGDLIIINTARGHKLSVTPNHPVLTPSGWVPAHRVNVGSYVVSSPVRQWEPSPRRDVNNENVPTRFHDVAESFAGSRAVMSAPVPIAPEDFHGDGLGSEVAVVWADSALWDGGNPARLKHLAEHHLCWGCSKDASLHCLRNLESMFFGPAAAGACLVCGSNLTLSLLGAHGGPLDPLGLGLIADGDSKLDQSSADGRSFAAVSLRERIFGRPRGIERGHFSHGKDTTPLDPSGFDLLPQGRTIRSGSAGVLQSKGLGTGSQSHSSTTDTVYDGAGADVQLAANLLNGSAGLVAPDYVISVDVQFFHGNVFNMESETGAYWANGILTHNCRCALALNP